MAICYLLIHSGLFIPAQAADLRYFDQVFYIGEDQQNVSMGLSSFSAETDQFISSLEINSDQSLWLIDEIFNSTSSEEASALSAGIIEHLHQTSQAVQMITTHHDNLKTIGQTISSVESAHMSFDGNNHIPTYKLIIGTPGQSHALKTFKRIASDHFFSDLSLIHI